MAVIPTKNEMLAKKKISVTKYAYYMTLNLLVRHKPFPKLNLVIDVKIKKQTNKQNENDIIISFAR